MTKDSHRVYLGFLSAIVVFTFFAVTYYGFSYYKLPVEERVFDQGQHIMFKPSGVFGHGYGIFGSLFMIAGVSLYMARKRFRSLSRMGLLKYWLEFHIFLCTLGPLLVLFHTAFKFGGLVAISFWSMVAVFASGVIGRFIYLQIPRSIEGRELTLSEIRDMKGDVAGIIRSSYNLDDESFNTIIESVKKGTGIYQNNPVVRYIRNRSDDRRSVRIVKRVLRHNGLRKAEYSKIINLVKGEITINRRIERLDTMQSLFKYWHVLHLPFALVMLIIMVIHIAVTFVFGYRWIF
jgi:hypothetical protein